MKARPNDGDQLTPDRRHSLSGHIPSVPVNKEDYHHPHNGRTLLHTSDTAINAPGRRVRVRDGAVVSPVQGSLTAILNLNGPETTDAARLLDLSYITSIAMVETHSTEDIRCHHRSYRGRSVNKEGYHSRQIHCSQSSAALAAKEEDVDADDFPTNLPDLKFQANYDNDCSNDDVDPVTD